MNAAISATHIPDGFFRAFSARIESIRRRGYQLHRGSAKRSRAVDTRASRRILKDDPKLGEARDDWAKIKYSRGHSSRLRASQKRTSKRRMAWQELSQRALARAGDLVKATNSEGLTHPTFFGPIAARKVLPPAPRVRNLKKCRDIPFQR